VTILVDEANAIADKVVATLGAANDYTFAVRHDKTVEIGEGWIFFYNTRDFIETGKFSSALAGNGPIFVNRNGDVRHLPSSVPWEVAIKGV
jgi:hypothetical protein